nr:immunoglobulin light chain junction region [Macaca mulatta]
CQQHNSYPCSF